MKDKILICPYCGHKYLGELKKHRQGKKHYDALVNIWIAQQEQAKLNFDELHKIRTDKL